MSDRRLRLLLALYPRRWRRCHGTELEAFLTEWGADRGALGPRESVGLVVNALVARATYNPILACAAAAMVIGMLLAVRAMAPGPERASVPTPAALVNQLIIQPSSSGKTLATGVRKVDAKTGKPVGAIRWSLRTGTRGSNTAPATTPH